jgi:membrane protein DedA with SNARE-associated domain
MDILVQHETLTFWITHYGSFAIFGLLALGIIALPIPDETLIVLAGIMLSQEKLIMAPTLMACYAGAICGISVSFLLGATAGKYLIRHYGGWLGFTEGRREQMHSWFRRYGKWTLVFGYFIPGVRHITGILAGMGKLEYPQFALFAYSGAFLWVSAFLSIGYFLGDYWVEAIENMEISIDTFVYIILAAAALYLLIKYLFRNKSL